MHSLLKREINLRIILYYCAIIFIFLILIGYTAFQARFLLLGPTVSFQNEPESIQTQRQIYLEGTAKNIVEITLNGRQIYTDKTGYFKEALVLENGYTISTISVRDRYGRTRAYTKEFVYTPDPLSVN